MKSKGGSEPHVQNNLLKISKFDNMKNNSHCHNRKSPIRTNGDHDCFIDVRA